MFRVGPALAAAVCAFAVSMVVAGCSSSASSNNVSARLQGFQADAVMDPATYGLQAATATALPSAGNPRNGPTSSTTTDSLVVELPAGPSLESRYVLAFQRLLQIGVTWQTIDCYPDGTYTSRGIRLIRVNGEAQPEQAAVQLALVTSGQSIGPVRTPYLQVSLEAVNEGAPPLATPAPSPAATIGQCPAQLAN